MSALTDIVRRRIAEDGPLTVAQYMALALGHPVHGYYRANDPLGVAGDFTTAPEISQMFGELLGLWCAEVWQRLGQPQTLRLVELGPGRGTLMRDALRAARVLPAFHDALSVHLVETSPVLRERQRQLLAHAGPPLAWHERLQEVPAGPMLILANEFFDALPVHQFQRGTEGWHERLVDWDPAAGCLTFTVEAAVSSRAESMLPVPVRSKSQAGAIAECRPAATAWIQAMAERFLHWGGAALVIDYGHGQSAAGDTVQGVRDHAYHSVLDAPGSADLSAHVDFAAMLQSARDAGLAAQGPMDQGAFLAALGIGQRADMLARKASEAQRQDIVAALHRLTAGDRMGRLFKVVCLADPRLAPLPPFDAP